MRDDVAQQHRPLADPQPATPARQERRMVEIVRKMRVEPWLLRDTDAIRESVRTTRGGPPRPPLAAPRGWRECSLAS